MQQQQQEVPTSHNEAYEFNTLRITTNNPNPNPTYEEIGNKRETVNM